MKIVLAANFVIYGLFLFYCTNIARRAAGSQAPGPGGTVAGGLFFTPLRFDATNRGSFNISGCMIDFMRCMEIIRPDLVCYLYGGGGLELFSHSACPLMREFCHDFYGVYDSYTFRFTLFARACYSNRNNIYT